MMFWRESASPLFYVDEAEDQMLLLGTDNDMNADWENGVFPR